MDTKENDNFKHKMGITNALEYSLKALNDLKKEMLSVDSQKKESAWIIGSFIIILTSNMIYNAQETIKESLQNNDANAADDLEKIKQKMIALIDDMIERKKINEQS